MKKVVILISLVLAITLGCSDSDENLIQENHLENIMLDDVKSLIPDQLINNISVVFRNEIGDEWNLKTSYQTAILENQVDGMNYNHEQFVVRYYDDNDASFRLDINGIGLYSFDKKLQKSISGFLMPSNPSGSASVNIEVEDGDVKVNEFDDYNPSIVINSKEFKNVFIGNNSFNSSGAYTEIMMNVHVGVVAFRDRNNVLWVFDKFEN